jgi:hypothetical protein
VRHALCFVLVIFGLALKILGRRLPVQTRLAVQEGVLLDRAAADLALVLSIVASRCRRGDMGDLLGDGVLAANLGDADV